MSIKSQAQREAVARYKSVAYDRVELRLPKGDRAALNSHADKMGESVNAFLKRAIAETIENDNKQNDPTE